MASPPAKFQAKVRTIGLVEIAHDGHEIRHLQRLPIGSGRPVHLTFLAIGTWPYAQIVIPGFFSLARWPVPPAAAHARPASSQSPEYAPFEKFRRERERALSFPKVPPEMNGSFPAEIPTPNSQLPTLAEEGYIAVHL